MLIFLLPILNSYAIVENSISVATAVYRPFIILEEDGSLSGIYYEYLAKLLKSSGLEANFQTLPISRILNYASKGTIDFFPFISDTPEAKENYVEVARFHKLLFVLVGLEKKLEFKKHVVVIGKLTDTLCPLFSDKDKKKIKFFEYKTIDQAIKMLQGKRINAICTTRELFKYELKKSSHANLKYFEIPSHRQEVSLSLFANKKLSPEKIESITKAAADMEQKKFLESVYKKYELNKIETL